MWEREKYTWPNHELSRFVPAAGMSWHVQLAGRGPVMLLIHGTGASTHSWRRLIPLLAQDFTVLAVDLPGHGFTASAAGPGAGTRSRTRSHGARAAASIAGMSHCLAALLKELKVQPAYCVGHSAGAVLLCRLALDGHVMPRVIISVNGAFIPLAGAAGVLLSPMARLMASGSLVPRLIAWSAGNPANLERVIAGTGSRLDAEGLELYARLVRRPEHVAGALEMMGNWDLYGFDRELVRLATPLALIVAGNDRTVPPHQAFTVKQWLPEAEIYPMPGLGHLAHEEQPALVTQELLKICRAHREPHAG